MEYFSKELIKEKREEKHLTQRQLAELLFVSEKTVSKWETGRGLPDVSFLPALAGALGLSVAELMSGKQRLNANRSANVLKGKFYVCPICGNVLFSLGELSASCCGVGLIAEEAEKTDGIAFPSGDEISVRIPSPMTKEDYVSFVSYVTCDRAEIVKLYPEQPAEVLFLRRGHGAICYFTLREGLFFQEV